MARPSFPARKFQTCRRAGASRCSITAASGMANGTARPRCSSSRISSSRNWTSEGHRDETCNPREHASTAIPFPTQVSRLGRRRAAAIAIVARHVLGGAGQTPPSEKINVASIGVGSQGLRVMLSFLRQPDVQGVAYLPFVWRGWYDFGGGALGDMGCYSFDTIFRALKLEAPTS